MERSAAPGPAWRSDLRRRRRSTVHAASSRPSHRLVSFQRPTELQMAFHEAGHAHAFASIVPGELPVELGLVPTPGGVIGWSKRLKVTETEGADRAREILGDTGAERWIAAAEAAIALAGPLAEARQREGSSAGGLVFLTLAMPQLLDPALPSIDPDFRHLRRMLRTVAPEAPLDTTRKLLVSTNELLNDCWPGVRHLARRLLADRRIDEAGLEAHFGRCGAVKRRAPAGGRR